MRPHLHPDMGQVVICARVARHLANNARRNVGELPPTAALYARRALATLPIELPGMLRLALHSLGVYLDLGYSSQQWLDCVLEAAHFGHTFRRCFFFAYKDNRSPYPRVTNRGVLTSAAPHHNKHRRGIADE